MMHMFLKLLNYVYNSVSMYLLITLSQWCGELHQLMRHNNL